MQIAVFPASARAGEATIRTLLSSPSSHKIKAFYRNPSKAPQEFQSDPRFEAVQGDAVSGDNLDLSGSEAVLYVAPLILNGEDSDELAAKAAANIKKETERVGTVKRLVLQSALGSQFDGIGVLRINKITDEALKNAAPRTFIVRPCTYYDNWVAALKSVQEGATSFDSYVSPADWKIPMVDMVDIGEYLAKLLLDDANTISTDAVDLFGPRLYSSNDVRDAIAQVTGKQVAVRSVPVEELTEWWGKQVPERYVKDFTEFVTCQLEGGIISVQRYGYDEHTVRGKRELVDFLRASL